MREATEDALGLHERASATPVRTNSGHAAIGGAAARFAELPRTLANQQRWFNEVVTTPEDAPAPIDEVSAARLVAPSATLSSIERLDIYRRGYHARLIECLTDDYPVLQHALGEERFEELCRAYIAAHPSRGPSLNAFGRHMAAFCAAQALPEPGFAADLARLEWAIVQAIHAPSAGVLRGEDLAGVADWTRARLSSNPSLQLLELGWPANAYLQAFRNQAATAAPPTTPRASVVAVYRTERTVWRMELEPALLVLVRALIAGETLADSLAQLEAALPANMSKAQAAELVTRWFRQTISSGMFSALTLADAPR